MEICWLLWHSYRGHVVMVCGKSWSYCFWTKGFFFCTVWIRRGLTPLFACFPSSHLPFTFHNSIPEWLTLKNNLFQKCTVIIYSFRFCMISFCCVQWNHPTNNWKKKSRWHFFSAFWTMKTKNTPLSLHYSVVSAPGRWLDHVSPLWRYSGQVYSCCRTISL